MDAPSLVGLRVLVKLKNPPSSLHGRVAIVHDQRLTISDVYFLRTGKHYPTYSLHGAEIEDIEVVSEDYEKHEARPQVRQSTLLADPTLPNLTPNKPVAFVDPAILGYTRGNLRELDSATAFTSDQSRARDSPLGALTDPKSYQPATRSGSLSLTNPNIVDETDLVKNAASATLTAPFDALNLHDNIISRNDEVIVFPGSTTLQTTNGNKQNGLRRDKTGNGQQSQSGDVIAVVEKPKTKRAKKQERKDENYPTRSKHLAVISSSPEKDAEDIVDEDETPTMWRPTPILLEQSTEPVEKGHRTPRVKASKMNQVVAASTGRKTRREQQLQREITKNAWASEQATDVQDLGDFDFEAGLSQFDKKSVWDQLRNEDTTADEDRLVAFNRVKPGTFGGQKLHPTENVLGRASSSARFTDHLESDSDLDDGEAGRRRRMLQNEIPRHVSPGSFYNHGSPTGIPSRKNSARAGDSLKSSGAADANRSMSRSRLTETLVSSARPQLSSTSSATTTMQPGPGQPTFRYVSNGGICRIIKPETLQAVEVMALTGGGMSQDLLEENAGRGIAQVVLSTIDPAGHRSQNDHNALPVVVMLIGENKAGARALAAARHLLERNVRVIASLTGPVDLEHGALSLQAPRFRGKVLRHWDETSAHLKTLDAPPELIVDALLGAHGLLNDFQDEHLSTAMQMMGWANRSRASVLSVDVPSGVDPTNGSVKMHEGEPIEVRARLVVCCGIPCTGLLEAMISREYEAVKRISIIDIGINSAARPFIKMNTNQKEGRNKGKYVHFGNDWVVAIELDMGPEKVH